jgi:predicted amidohydrolase
MNRELWRMVYRVALSPVIAAALIQLNSTPLRAEQPAPTDHWQAVSLRDEIRPNFSDPTSADSAAAGPLVIATDERVGLQGWWQKFVPVEPERWYRFSVRRRASGVTEPRRQVFARIDWRDDTGRQVNFDEPVVDFYARGGMREATPEFPAEQDAEQSSQQSTDQTAAQSIDDESWTTLAGVYRAPAGARRAVIELHLQWAANARVEWRDVTLTPCEAPQGRRVRLATVHYSPKGKTPLDNCRQFAPLIAEAARQQADLVVLPETVTLPGTGLSYADVAEAIPGPSTDYFSGLARTHHVTLVVGLVERAEHLIYNVAVLIGPDGALLGKYRKVCLPRGEIEQGVMPGDAYPVFRTPWGKVGLMVCYDGFFPEVARELANRGAEVIAFPVAGCNPELVAARACENHVYLVSSSYTDAAQHWTVTGIYDHQGQLLKQADKWGTIAVAEVDLDRPTRWANLGDFKAQLPRHRPADRAAASATKAED